MPNPNPSQDTLTLTVVYDGVPYTMEPVTRTSGESNGHLSRRAMEVAAVYGDVNDLGKLESVVPVWS